MQITRLNLLLRSHKRRLMQPHRIWELRLKQISYFFVTTAITSASARFSSAVRSGSERTWRFGATMISNGHTAHHGHNATQVSLEYTMRSSFSSSSLM